jgi:8-oxo-dGTP pyrophosphatase MutT (NUDIX family)
MNVFNEAEYLDICKKLNSGGNISDVAVRYEAPSYFNRLKSAVQHDRRGEVVFCVLRPNGKIITITCSEYPKGIYRIPTGGIGHKEDILAAVYREVKEELGLEVKIRTFGGVVRIRFEYGREHVMFYSYLFILDETGGRLLEDASDDEIGEVREVDLDDLEPVVRKLGEITGKWRDWGQFRYVTTKAVYEFLRENP